MRKILLLALLASVTASAHAELPAMTEAEIAQYAADVAYVLGLLISAGMAIDFLISLGYRLGWLDDSDSQ